MSQNLSVDLAEPSRSEDVSSAQNGDDSIMEPANLLASPVALLDDRADAVMDDLFHDLDQALAGKGQLKETPPVQRTESGAQLATRGAETGQRPSLLQDGSVSTNDRETTSSALQTETAAPDASALSQAKESVSPPRAQKAVLIERLLVVAACLSVAAVGAAWFVLNQLRLQSQQAAVPVETATGNLQAPVDQNFVDYVARSLNAIDRRTETQRQVASVSGTVAGRGQSSVAVPQNASGAPQVMERVYVPLYQPPAVASNNYALPNLPSLSTGPLPSLAPAAPNPPNIASTGTHVLVGVLELGDRSAALFEVNGTTQRINIGERIGTSGWALVSVSNQEAIVRRNGEVRSVYIGQQF